MDLGKIKLVDGLWTFKSVFDNILDERDLIPVSTVIVISINPHTKFERGTVLVLIKLA